MVALINFWPCFGPNGKRTSSRTRKLGNRKDLDCLAGFELGTVPETAALRFRREGTASVGRGVGRGAMLSKFNRTVQKRFSGMSIASHDYSVEEKQENHR